MGCVSPSCPTGATSGSASRARPAAAAARETAAAAGVSPLAGTSEGPARRGGFGRVGRAGQLWGRRPKRCAPARHGR
eukprot:11218618-Lingulodinium_polyedra.AAC.1